jgi:hypothetical protein
MIEDMPVGTARAAMTRARAADPLHDSCCRHEAGVLLGTLRRLSQSIFITGESDIPMFVQAKKAGASTL